MKNVYKILMHGTKTMEGSLGQIAQELMWLSERVLPGTPIEIWRKAGKQWRLEDGFVTRSTPSNFHSFLVSEEKPK